MLWIEKIGFRIALCAGGTVSSRLFLLTEQTTPLLHRQGKTRFRVVKPYVRQNGGIFRHSCQHAAVAQELIVLRINAHGILAQFAHQLAAGAETGQLLQQRLTFGRGNVNGVLSGVNDAKTPRHLCKGEGLTSTEFRISGSSSAFMPLFTYSSSRK